MSEEVSIDAAIEVDDELVEVMQRLVPQVSTSSLPPTAEFLNLIVSDPNEVLFLARVNGKIIGALTVAFIRIPTGLKAWVEDVVVDTSMRGLGIGEKLVQAAMEEGTRRGVKSIELTSNPKRESANRLYLRVGFNQRVTNVYRYKP